MEPSGKIWIMIPCEDLEFLKRKIQIITDQLEHLRLDLKKNQAPQKKIYPEYLTAKEFMDAIHIKRSKFDQLIASNKIKAIKKARRIYIPAGEVERFYKDSSIR